MKKQFSALLLAVVMLCVMSLPAYADTALDLSQTGSVSITVMDNNRAVSGGSLTLYRVGTITEDGSGYMLTDDFSSSKESLTNPSSAALAKRLAQYAQKQKLSGTTQNINSNGQVTFSDLELGLYLLVQDKAASGYQQMAPFLVTVPMLENGGYVYDVDASPKTEVQKTPSTPSNPTPSNPTRTPTTPTNPTTSTKQPGSYKLPNTGQLNWPIPVLVVSGLGLFSIGWMLCYGKKGTSYEK